MSRLAFAAVLAFVLCLPSVAAAAPKRCGHGKVVWRVEGKQRCGANPAARRAPAGPAVATFARGAVARVPRARVPRTLRRALPGVARRAGALADRIVTEPWHTARAAADGHGAVVDRLEFEPETIQMNGVEVTVRGRGRAYADDTTDMDIAFEVTKGEDTVSIEPVFDDLFTDTPKVGCPSAAGLVTYDDVVNAGNTVKVLRGRRVRSAYTERVRMEKRMRGYVGRDAHLDHVDVDIVSQYRRYERGRQTEITFSAPVQVRRDGTASLLGTPTVDAKLRVAGASRREELAAEREYAAERLRDPSLQDDLRALAQEGFASIKRAEPKWYDVPNRCASVDWSVYPLKIAKGQRKTITARVEAADGGEASGQIAITAVHRGALSGRTTVDPGAPARFTATGAAPDRDKATLIVDVLAASTAGRSESSLYGMDERKVPRSFTGTVSADTELPGAFTDVWQGTATYTLASTTSAADGSLVASYDLTGGTVTNAVSTLGGAGCHHEASGSGGSIMGGAIVLRVAADGSARYGFQYDLELPTTYQPVGCPPGTPPIDRPITAAISTFIPGPPDAQFRPAGFGMKLHGENEFNAVAAPGSAATASWDLAPTG
jgi:hypothetical protein